MNALLKYSFVVDVLGGVAAIAYGIWSSSAFWLWGGVAGLAFSLVWRRVQPLLLNAVIRKKKAVRPSNEAAPIPVAPLTVANAELPSATAAAPEAAPVRNSIAVDRWHITPPKDGRLRYY